MTHTEMVNVICWSAAISSWSPIFFPAMRTLPYFYFCLKSVAFVLSLLATSLVTDPFTEVLWVVASVLAFLNLVVAWSRT